MLVYVSFFVTHRDNVISGYSSDKRVQYGYKVSMCVRAHVVVTVY